MTISYVIKYKMFIFWVFAMAIVVLIIKMMPVIRKYKRLYDFSKTLPGPSIFEVMAGTRGGKLLDFLVECRQKYGPVFKVWFGLEWNFFFCDPDDVRTILTSQELIHKANKYTNFEIWLGKGLLTNGGENWRLKRKLLTPGFHFSILGSFKKPIEECCDILIDRLDDIADGRAVDIYKYITLFALDVICETAMGIKVNSQLNDNSDFVLNTQRVCSIIYKRVISQWKRFPFLYQFTSDKKECDECLKLLHGETRRVTQLRRSKLDAEIENKSNGSSEDNKETDGLVSKQRRPFLDSLLIAQRESGLLSDDNIQEETDTFMFGGHDTISTALSFGIYLLAKHPQVQQILFEEIRNSGDTDLPYMEAVIKEILRLYPPVITFSRQTLQPFQIGKHLVPQSATIVTNVYLIHHNAEHHPDPESFRPERFMKGAQPIHPFAYIPFSAGPRNCIGQKFAILELKITLCKLLPAFKFTAVPNYEIDIYPNLVLKSLNGVMVHVHKRQS